MKTFGALASLIAIVSLGAIAPASASPVTYWFTGTFSDGQTASGDFTLNTYGYPTAPTSITTATGLFAGYTYALPSDPSSILDSATVLVLSSPSYNRYLYLDFSQPLTLGGTDNLIAASSFECNGFGSTTNACTANASNIRYFTNGTAVPEPLTLSLFSAGLLGMAFFGRRKILGDQKRTAV
jgi:hypothetical protein